MAEKFNTTLELLAEVPTAQRKRIVAGMRWTVWLAALSMPFSYGTAVLLARTSPEAIGTYGLLAVYISVVLSLFYLGGDAVVIKFLPEVDTSERLSFLASYFLVLCLSVVPWLAAATIRPDKLHYLLGEKGGPDLQLFVLYLSPLCILASLTGAALKAMLEISWAQALARAVNIGFFLLYAGLFASAPGLLAARYTLVIWGIYLSLTLVVAGVGLWRLLQLNEWSLRQGTLHFFLPRRFWSYTLSLQALSAVGFFTQRLDVILVLNFGNLALLGKYVAIITLVETIRLIGKFFLDTLLPSLTNMVAARNLGGASDVFSVHMRILFLVTAASTCGLILLAVPLTALLGAKYASLDSMVILLALLVGLAAPSAVAGTLLSSVGKQIRALWMSLGQVGLYVMLFVFLWPRWNLLGAVLAYGLALLVCYPPLLLIAKHCVPFQISVGRDYAKFGLVVGTAALVAFWLKPLGLGLGLVGWACAMGLFLALANYSAAECMSLVRCFVPASFSSPPSGSSQ